MYTCMMCIQLQMISTEICMYTHMQVYIFTLPKGIWPQGGIAVLGSVFVY